MAIHLSRDLENLQRRVLSLASAVEQAVEKAMRALFERDVQLAKNLVASDTPIDMVVGYSNLEAARAMTHALVASGRRKIGYIGQTGRDYIDRVQERYSGYCLALRDDDVGVREKLQVEVELSYRGGASGLAELLGRECGEPKELPRGCLAFPPVPLEELS